MERADDFLLADNWHGHWYELAIQLGPRTDPAADTRLDSAQRAIWTSPALEGCYLDRRKEPSAQARILPADLELDPTRASFVYGWAQIPQGQMVCLTNFVREEGPDGADWLDLCLPEGALERVEPRLYEDHRGGDSWTWRQAVDAWFVEVARHVARSVEFERAIIGEDVSGFDTATNSTGRRTLSEITCDSGEITWHPPDP